LEKLAKQLSKFTIRAESANEFVEKLQKVAANAQAALATAQESIANQGKSTEQLYLEAQEKQANAEAAALERAAEAARQKNLQKEMEAAARAKKEAEARKKKEAEQKAVLEEARAAAAQAALNEAGVAKQLEFYRQQLADEQAKSAPSAALVFQFEGMITTLGAADLENKKIKKQKADE